MADGVVQKTELASIAMVASREGVSPHKVKELIANPEKTDLVVPKSNDKKLRYLKDMVLLMMSDGDIDVRPLCCRLRQLHYALLCKQGGHHALAADSLVFLQHFLYADNGLRQALQILLYCKLGRIHLLLFKHRQS